MKLLRALGFDRLLLWNTLASAAAGAGFALLDQTTSHWLIAFWVLVFGMIRNIQFNTLQTLTYADMPSEGLSRATSLGGGIQHLRSNLQIRGGEAALVAASISHDPIQLRVHRRGLRGSLHIRSGDADLAPASLAHDPMPGGLLQPLQLQGHVGAVIALLEHLVLLLKIEQGT